MLVQFRPLKVVSCLPRLRHRLLQIAHDGHFALLLSLGRVELQLVQQVLVQVATSLLPLQFFDTPSCVFVSHRRPLVVVLE